MDLICKCGKEAEVQTFNLSRIKYCMYCGYYEIHDIECDHEYKQILFKLSNGNKQLREYCPKCHQRSPQPLKQNKFKKYRKLIKYISSDDSKLVKNIVYVNN